MAYGTGNIFPHGHSERLRDVLESVFDGVDRWTFFSSEEVREISAAESDRSNNGALPEELRERAHKIAVEALAEDRRRLGGYQGPGVYKSTGGTEWRVIGHIGENGPIVMSAPDSDHFLYAETWNDFNFFLPDGTPTYRYLRPLRG